MFSPQGMFTGRDTADQIWKAFRSALMWAKVKSYLRHSKDRRVRGSANGAATVCVFPERQKSFTHRRFFLPNLLRNYKSLTAPCLPPARWHGGFSIFSLCGPHVKSDQLLITVFPKWTSEVPSELWNLFFFFPKQVYSCVPHTCIIWNRELIEEKSQKNTGMGGFSSHLPQRKYKQHTHTQYKNCTQHLRTKFFIYFVTTSYTFPESFHCDTTVTQDKSIWHIAIKAKTSIESTDYYCFP